MAVHEYYPPWDDRSGMWTPEIRAYERQLLEEIAERNKMATANYNIEEHKTALTPQEKLRVAVAVLIDGFDQHKVAALMGVNPGRINEAVQAVRIALSFGE